MNTTDKAGVAEIDNAMNGAAQAGRPAGSDSRAEWHGAIDKAADKAHPVIDRLADTAHPTIDRLANTAHGGVDKVGDTINKASASIDELSVTLAERSKQLGQACKRFAETGRGYVRNRPATSLLVAVAAGYGLSKLMGSRK
ncbi:MAG TPA: hypothetical protein VGP06_10270 [Janthinobacterium sp.]|nr:hypothetical protein [Janthinobacterium sp.]